MRLIDAEALEESIEQIDWYHLARNGEMAKGATSENGWYKEQDIYNAIEEAPTIEAKPVVHGQWISKNPHGYEWIFVCSNCGYIDGYPFNDRSNYCPNCGAQMDEKEDT